MDTTQHSSLRDALATRSALDIAVPDAVRVFGHDNTLLADLSNPSLTSMALVTPDLAERLIANVVSVCQGGPVLDTGTPQATVVGRASA